MLLILKAGSGHAVQTRIAVYQDASMRHPLVAILLAPIMDLKPTLELLLCLYNQFMDTSTVGDMEKIQNGISMLHLDNLFTALLQLIY